VPVKSVENTIRSLRDELRFIQKGGYRTPLAWRSPLIFEDSAICPKEKCSVCPDGVCVLISLVPTELRSETAPCRHIPLNETGETLDSLYRTGTNEEIEQALEIWLLKTIRQLEESSEAQCFERAA
jgi:hypothetical protein